MLRHLTAFFLFTPAVLMAQEPAATPAARKKLPAIALLPDGSQLKGVMLPRYDENRKLVGVLKAKAMTLVNDEQIAGETIAIEFFNPDQSPRGRVDLTKAVFYQSRGVLEAMEDVEIHADRLSAHGSALHYAFEQGEGFLSGPATTIIHALPETTMNTPRPSLRATAMIGMSLLTQSLVAAPPPAMTAEEKAAIQQDAASKSAAVVEAGTATREELETSVAASDAADRAAQTFLVQANIPVPPASQPAAAAKPLDVKPGPDDTVITCDGGMYFDADEGVLVYMKNVKVTDSRFDLSGANELKVFFEKKPADAPKKEKPEASKNGFGNVGANFSEVERIVATGAVHILQKKAEGDKPPVEASGAIFTYHVKTGEIILSGGYPWVKQGASFMRAGEPNLNLRIQKSGSFSTEGNWTMGGNLNQKN